VLTGTNLPADVFFGEASAVVELPVSLAETTLYTSFSLEKGILNALLLNVGVLNIRPVDVVSGEAFADVEFSLSESTLHTSFSPKTGVLNALLLVAAGVLNILTEQLLSIKAFAVVELSSGE